MDHLAKLHATGDARIDAELAALESEMPALQTRAANVFALASAWAERHDAILAATPASALAQVQARLRRIGIRWGMVPGARVTGQFPALTLPDAGDARPAGTQSARGAARPAPGSSPQPDTAAKAARAIQSEASTSAKVLIVDDQPALSELIADMLADAGYATTTATDGHAALRSMRAERPDLLLLDAQMPGMDGFELATRLKADPATAAIPIIMLSSNAGRASRMVGLESGAEDYLGKPVDRAELLAKIRNLLRLRDRAAQAH